MWFAKIEHFKGGKRTEAKSSSRTSIASLLSFFLSLWSMWGFNVCVGALCVFVCLTFTEFKSSKSFSVGRRPVWLFYGTEMIPPSSSCLL